MKTALVALGFLWSGMAYAHHGMTHLTFADAGVHAHITWEAGPLLNDESIMHIEWKSAADHTPVAAPGDVTVANFMVMNGMQHGSSPTTIEQVVDENGAPVVGSYRVKEMYFVMEGEWRIDVTLAVPDRPADTQSFTVEIGGGGHQHQR
jgi:hypothetical protein